MSIIALVSPKGGAGKSTLLLALADTSALSKLKVCIVDADPQRSLIGWSHRRAEAGRNGGPIVIDGGENLPLTIQTAASEYEMVLVDCPGESEAKTRTRAALVLSDVVLIPVKENEFDMNAALEHVIPLLEEARRASEGRTSYALIPSMVHPSANKGAVLGRFEGAGVEVLGAVYVTRKALAEFPAGGRTLKEHGKTSADAKKATKAALYDMNQIANAAMMLLKG